MDAQTDLGRHCPHMREGTFSHGAVHILLMIPDKEKSSGIFKLHLPTVATDMHSFLGHAQFSF